jgi:hypothetical protein
VIRGVTGDVTSRVGSGVTCQSLNLPAVCRLPVGVGTGRRMTAVGKDRITVVALSNGNTYIPVERGTRRMREKRGESHHDQTSVFLLISSVFGSSQNW